MDMVPLEISSKTRAIICFGPHTDISGFRVGEYYQVVIDPEKQSPGGQFIRFDPSAECEVCGWQRLAAFTVCEVLHVDDEKSKETVTVKAVDG